MWVASQEGGNRHQVAWLRSLRHHDRFFAQCLHQQPVMAHASDFTAAGTVIGPIELV